MHILMFSYDRALIDKNPVGDVLLRHQHYAEHLDRLDILVPVPSQERRSEVKASENLTVYPSYGPKVLSWLRAYLQARRICRESRVDIVVAQDALLGGLGVLLQKEFDCKLQINAFGLEIFSDLWLRQSLLHRLYKLAMCWALRRADLIRTDGTKDRLSLIERLKIPSGKVVTLPIVPGPESISRFTGASGDVVRKDLLGDKYQKLVLFVGMLIKQKNIPNLLRAARLVLKDHPETLFAIIGDGPEREYLERVCRELDIAQHVRFLGLVPYDNLPEYYAASDVFALPSWYEGFARVLMEAALARKPIVATDVSGADDIIVDNETGYIVALDNSEQLADRIERLLGNPRLALQMGSKGYQRAIDYCDFDKNTARLIGVWQSLLVGGKNTASR